MRQTATVKFVLPELYQIAAVVKDIDKAAEHYSSFNIGPFHIREAKLDNIKVRGKPVSIRLKLGFARLGPVQFEIIQPLEGESIYREFLDQNGEGIHHLAFMVTDLEAELAKLEKTGISVLMRNKTFAYLDTREVGGVIFELIGRLSR